MDKHPPKERIIIQEFESEKDAFEAEAFLISFFGREDQGLGKLLNLTDGGENSPTNKGKKFSEEHKDRIRTALLGNTNGKYTSGLVWTKAHRRVHKEAMQNRNIPPASRERMRTNKGKKMSKENLEILVLLNTGRTVSDETKNRISLANTGKKRTEESKRKMREAWVRRRANAR